jgi:DNA-directed RNA polymerase subunit alpha
MLGYKNFGETSLREVKEILSSKGLRLGMLKEDAATRYDVDRQKRVQNEAQAKKLISELQDLGIRARNAFEKNGITTVGDLIKRTESDLAMIRGMGKSTMPDLKKILGKMGLSLRAEIKIEEEYVDDREEEEDEEYSEESVSVEVKDLLEEE